MLSAQNAHPHTFTVPYLASYSHYEVLLELLAAEAMLAFVHGDSQPPALPDGSVPHPLLLPPLAFPLRCSRYKHVIQRVVVTIRFPHHLEIEVLSV